MDKDYWLYQQHSHWQALNQNSMSFKLDSSRHDSFGAYTDLYATHMVATNGSLPELAGSLPLSKASQLNEPHGWFYCLPRHRQFSTHTPNALPIRLSPSSFGYGEVPRRYGGAAMPNAIQGSDQKKFLVFDKSVDKTNLFFSSELGSHALNPNDGGPRPHFASGFRMIEPTINRALVNEARPVISTKEENQESDDRSEMHEDTEELNALLYSDGDDSYEEDDEETSTGHSPCDIIGEKDIEEGEEEVASSACPMKRKRHLEEDCYSSSLVDTASSGEANESMERKGDSESSCGEGSSTEGEIGFFLPRNKRMRKERIRETVSILQSIIPGGEGKDAILVLDEAIRYLKTLKAQTKSLNWRE